ncbi:3-deoxy-D-manno-octulosonic acid transferase [Bergeyella porcorum]|uniref:3-deoxy-D-manno-octulosonic acid transferase n=1 Tax=Bergeyella porcorum TaxID=1735111 RepID=UPI0035E5721B
MQFIYNIFITLLAFGLRLLSWFNEKAKKGVQGRKKSLAIVKEKLANQKVIWMHAASLGEYEQGLPVLEQIRQQFPSHKVLVTFFSPSGYENVVKKQHIADAVCYLPFDKKQDIKAFVSVFQTEIFFTVKYDFWYHLLRGLKEQGAKIYVVSALFYEKQAFFKPYGKWLVQQLKQNVDWFFHQTKHSEELAKKIGLINSSVSGDTRFDRVKQIQHRDNTVPFIKKFKGDSPLVVFGSSWEAEEGIADRVASQYPNAKIIIAPHDIKRNIGLKHYRNPLLKYSELNEKSNDLSLASNILVIDSIGLLSKIYAYADIAVVGGGFHTAGLHNILEAATFGKPVVFGNHYKKNPEADGLIHFGGAQSFSTEGEAADFVLKLLNDAGLREKMAIKAKQFVQMQPNATEVVVKKILER